MKKLDLQAMENFGPGGFNWCYAAGAALVIGMGALTGGVAILAWGGAAAIAAGATSASVGTGLAMGGALTTGGSLAIGGSVCNSNR